MKKGLKSLIYSALLPLAVAQAQSSRLGFSWEWSYQPEGFSTEQQLEFQSEDIFIATSITAQDSNTSYGATANTGKVNKSLGHFKGKPQKSYFNGVNKQRDNTIYFGLRVAEMPARDEQEIFAGAKLGKFFFNGSTSSTGKLDNKLYADFGGNVIGLTNERDKALESSGIYYRKGDFGGQFNFNAQNQGSKLFFRNILSRTGDSIFNASERLDAQIGYGQETGKTLELGYNLDLPKGPLERFNLSIGYTDNVNSRGTVIDNQIKIRGKNPAQIRLRYETKSNKADFGLDFRY